MSSGGRDRLAASFCAAPIVAATVASLMRIAFQARSKAKLEAKTGEQAAA
jgi:hypothetical protein